MDSMTAFFHAGPLNLAINDLPTYDKDRELTQTNWRDVPPTSLGLPSLGAGEWNWLQSYVRPKPTVSPPVPLPPAELLPAPVPPTTTAAIMTAGGDDGASSATGTTNPPSTAPPVVVDASQPTFNSFGIDKRGDLTKPGFQKGPYVATEGYLQLRSPLTAKASAKKDLSGTGTDRGAGTRTGVATGTDTDLAR